MLNTRQQVDNHIRFRSPNSYGHDRRRHIVHSDPCTNHRRKRVPVCEEHGNGPPHAYTTAHYVNDILGCHIERQRSENERGAKQKVDDHRGGDGDAEEPIEALSPIDPASQTEGDVYHQVGEQREVKIVQYFKAELGYLRGRSQGVAHAQAEDQHFSGHTTAAQAGQLQESLASEDAKVHGAVGGAHPRDGQGCDGASEEDDRVEGGDVDVDGIIHEYDVEYMLGQDTTEKDMARRSDGTTKVRWNCYKCKTMIHNRSWKLYRPSRLDPSMTTMVAG